MSNKRLAVIITLFTRATKPFFTQLGLSFNKEGTLKGFGFDAAFDIKKLDLDNLPDLDVIVYPENLGFSEGQKLLLEQLSTLYDEVFICRHKEIGLMNDICECF